MEWYLLVPVYSELYSYNTEVTSEYKKILEIIERVSKYSKRESIYVTDRGGDRREHVTPLLSSDKYFIIHQVSNRHLYYRGQKLTERKISRKVRLIHS